jgi:hypothetical protein
MARAAGLWANWLLQRVHLQNSLPSPSLVDWIYIPAKCPEAPDDELLPLSLTSSMGPVAEGACVMLNLAMVSMVQNIVLAGGVGQSGSGALVLDLSFKLNASGFGLAGMAVPAKHLHNGCWRTESILLGFIGQSFILFSNRCFVFILLFMFFLQCAFLCCIAINIFLGVIVIVFYLTPARSWLGA